VFNVVSKKDAYPIPDIQDALDNLTGAKYFATFDLLSGYWQLGLTDRAKVPSVPGEDYFALLGCHLDLQLLRARFVV